MTFDAKSNCDYKFCDCVLQAQYVVKTALWMKQYMQICTYPGYMCCLDSEYDVIHVLQSDSYTIHITSVNIEVYRCSCGHGDK